MPAPIPALSLSNALLFADPTFDCLSGLGQEPDRWQDAVVLSTPFWLPRTGKLHRPLDLEEGNTSLVVASIRFDPERELTIDSKNFSPEAQLDSVTKCALATASRIRVLPSFPAASLPDLLHLMPGLTAVHFATAQQLTAATASLASLTGLQELRVTNCRGLSDLSVRVALPALHTLSLGCCFNLEDVSALASLTSLRELSLRGCPCQPDVSVVDALPSLRTRNITLCVNSGQDDPWEYNTETLPHEVPVELLGTYADFLCSDDPDENMQGTLMIRKMLSADFGPPVCEVIDEGCVPKFTAQLLRDDFPQLQVESASALAKIVCVGSVGLMRILAETPETVPNLVRLLGSPDEDCRKQACCAIANFSCEGAAPRDVCLDHGALPGLITVVTANGQKKATIQQEVWALSNLCRWKPLPKHEQVAPALPILVDLLNHEDEALIVDAAWAFAYLSDGPKDRIQQVLDAGCVPRLVELLRSDSSAIVMPAIRVFGNVAAANEDLVDALLTGGVLSSFQTLIKHEKRSIRKEVCFAISNITTRSPNHIQAVIDANLIPGIMDATKAPENAVINEALWAITNATSGGSQAQISILVQLGVLPCLCDVLRKDISKFDTLVLESIDNVLAVGVRKRKENQLESNPFADEIVNCGGVERLEYLRNHTDINICNHVGAILEAHFHKSCEEDEPTWGDEMEMKGWELCCD